MLASVEIILAAAWSGSTALSRSVTAEKGTVQYSVTVVSSSGDECMHASVHCMLSTGTGTDRRLEIGPQLPQLAKAAAHDACELSEACHLRALPWFLACLRSTRHAPVMASAGYCVARWPVIPPLLGAL